MQKKSLYFAGIRVECAWPGNISAQMWEPEANGMECIRNILQTWESLTFSNTLVTHPPPFHSLSNEGWVPFSNPTSPLMRFALNHIFNGFGYDKYFPNGATIYSATYKNSIHCTYIVPLSIHTTQYTRYHINYKIFVTQSLFRFLSFSLRPLSLCWL